MNLLHLAWTARPSAGGASSCWPYGYAGRAAQPRRAADAPISVVLLCWRRVGAPLMPGVGRHYAKSPRDIALRRTDTAAR